jgi:hypothetical protein
MWIHLATFINVILMLNLLISILGDTCDQFQVEKNMIDYIEKAELILEIQKMTFWAKKKSEFKYFHVVTPASLGEQTEDWEGRVNFLGKKIEKHMQIINTSQKEMQIDSAMRFREVDEKIHSVEFNIKKMAKKIISIEEKLEGFDTKINGLENKLDGVGDNVGKILQLLVFNKEADN